MDADSLKAAGSSVGTAGMIVMDEDADLIRVLTRIAKFYYHESCGHARHAGKEPSGCLKS